MIIETWLLAAQLSVRPRQGASGSARPRRWPLAVIGATETSPPNTLSLANGLTESYTRNDRLQLGGLNVGNALALSTFLAISYASCASAE